MNKGNHQRIQDLPIGTSGTAPTHGERTALRNG